MADFRATITDVKGKKGTSANPRAGVQINLVTYSIETGQELLPFNGHDVVVTIEPMDRRMFVEQANGTNGAVEPEADMAEEAPTPLRRRGRRRRETAPEGP